MGSGPENQACLENFMLDNLSKNAIVVELGCGKGDRLQFIKHNITRTCIGVEVFVPYLAECYDKDLQVIQADLLSFLEHMRAPDTHKVEFVLLDVLEHLTKDDAYKAIALMQEVGSTILAFSPKGFCPQEEYDNNTYQKHLSQWEPYELESLGFTTEVVQNFHEGLPNTWSADVIFAIWRQ